MVRAAARVERDRVSMVGERGLSMDEIGKLGFGFMRLPVVEGDGGKEIDIEQVKHMVDLFMDAGFTYFAVSYTHLDVYKRQV